MAICTACLAACGGGGGGNDGGGSGSSPPPSPPAAAPTVTINAGATNLIAGTQTSITWSSTGATACTASGAWSGSLGTSGTQVVGPLQQSGSYSMACSGSGGTSDTKTVNVSVRLAFDQSASSVNDAAWEPRQGLLYLAMGSDAAPNPNSVVAFDPATGTVRLAVRALSEPVALAISDDGHYLYLGFRGTDVLSRYVLPDLTLDATFPVDPGNRVLRDEPKFPDQIAVAPAAPLTVGVALKTYRTLPYSSGLSIFDDQTVRPLAVNYTGVANWIAWGADSNRLYAAAFGGDILALSTTPSVGPSGQTTASGVKSGFTVYATAYGNGVVYDALGGVFDATTLARTGTLSSPGIVTVDAANRTVFVASWDDQTLATTIASYDVGSFTPRESFQLKRNDANNTVVTPGQVRRLIRWGTDGLAIVGKFGTLALLRGPFVASGGTLGPIHTLPVGSRDALFITPSITTSSIAANDVLWDARHSLLLASVPMDATDHPSSIAVIDPATGAAKSFVSTATEPGALAMSDDGQYLFVASATKIQRFVLPALTLDATADLPGRAQLTPQVGLAPHSVTVRPGDPRTISVDGMLLRDFVQLSSGLSSATTMQWSADGNTLYGSARINGERLALWSTTAFLTGGAVTNLGTPFSHPFPMNAGTIPDADFQQADGRLYSDSGAVFDPTTGGWPGTLPFAETFDLEDPTGSSYGIGKLALDIPKRRAYAVVCKVMAVLGACGNSLVSFDIDSYLPVTIADLPSVSGWAYRLRELSPTSFALVSADRKLVLVKGAEYAR